jgi:hypothetical protein
MMGRSLLIGNLEGRSPAAVRETSRCPSENTAVHVNLIFNKSN